MRSQQNMAGGISLILDDRDSLDVVPDSHQDIITLEILHAFKNPLQYFGAIADRCEFPQMAGWLRAVTKGNKWKLVLEEGFMMERSTRGGFHWWSDAVTSAFVSLAAEPNRPHPMSAFTHYYSLVGVVHWDNFGCAGGLLGTNEHITLKNYGAPCHDKSFPASQTRVWGNSSCGDMLIYSEAGTAGYLSHENGKAYELGSVKQGIEFVFGELLKGRTPEFDYSRI
ncbi:MAG: hypothetical protein K8R36_24460 [Planctomycetales bacterium]|nr:hypothetical protein [Planctomycetales bacterium]